MGKGMKNNFMTKLLGFTLAFALVLIGCMDSQATVSAAGKPALNKKRVSVQLNKTISLSVKNAKATVKWSSSDSDVVKITKISGPKKSKVVLRGMSKGSAVITAQVGGKKLKANVTVKHTHSYTYPATCTSPAKCSCGATYGQPLGHTFVGGTCTTRERCSRCGAEGEYGNHAYDTDTGICQICNTIKLDNVIGLGFEKVDSYIHLYASSFVDGGFNFVKDSFELYPSVNSDQVCDLTYEYGNITDMAVFPTYDDVPLRIPVGLNGWKTPRLEFDISVDVRTDSAGKVEVFTQVYHVVIEGESSCYLNGQISLNAVEDVLRHKEFTYTRVR